MRRLAGELVYAIDLPGHAGSPGPGEDSIAAYWNRVAGWMEALAIEAAVLVGHSMGGAIASFAAIEAPERVAGLVMIGSGARLRVHPHILDLTSREETLAEALELIMRAAFSPKASPQLISAARSQMAETSAPTLHGDFRACDAHDVMPLLAAIQAPTLILCGTGDQLTPPKYSRFLADEIPKAKSILIEDAGHMVMLEQPDQVAQAVASYMRAFFG